MDNTLDTLIQLKFNVEKEISILDSTIKDVASLDNSLDVVDRHSTDVSNLVNQYLMETSIFRKQHQNKSLSILLQINTLLNVICKHDWVEDTVEDRSGERDICYCRKCFMRK